MLKPPITGLRIIIPKSSHMQKKYDQLTKELHDLFSNNQFDKCLELVADNAEVTATALGMTFHGRDEFSNFMMGFKQAFPDIVIAHKNIVANGNKVAVEFTATGTHTGPLQTPTGVIPATGKKVTLNVSEFIEWQNGQFTKLVNYQDSASLMRQIGAI